MGTITIHNIRTIHGPLANNSRHFHPLLINASDSDNVYSYSISRVCLPILWNRSPWEKNALAKLWTTRMQNVIGLVGQIQFNFRTATRLRKCWLCSIGLLSNY